MAVEIFYKMDASWKLNFPETTSGRNLAQRAYNTWHICLTNNNVCFKPLWQTANHSLIYFLKYQLKSTGLFKLITRRFLNTLKIRDEHHAIYTTSIIWIKLLFPSFFLGLSVVSERDHIESKSDDERSVTNVAKHRENNFTAVKPISSFYSLANHQYQ